MKVAQPDVVVVVTVHPDGELHCAHASLILLGTPMPDVSAKSRNSLRAMAFAIEGATKVLHRTADLHDERARMAAEATRTALADAREAQKQSQAENQEDT